MENLKPRRQSNLSTACSRPEVALLDQVEQIHALGEGVAAGDADHEAEVGADEPVLRVGGRCNGSLQGGATLAAGELLGSLAAGLDDAGQFALVLSGEQRNLANVVQVQTNGVVHDVFVNRSYA